MAQDFDVGAPWVALVAVTLLLLGASADARFDPKRPLRTRLVIRLAVFAVATWLLQRSTRLPTVAEPSLSPGTRAWAGLVEGGRWLPGGLAPDERGWFAEHFEAVRYDTGEALIRQDGMPEAVFLIAAGTVGVTRAEAGTTRGLLRAARPTPPAPCR